MSTVGDGGAGWLRRALRRAQEQAASENRTLEEVAAERWGVSRFFNSSKRIMSDFLVPTKAEGYAGRGRAERNFC